MPAAATSAAARSVSTIHTDMAAPAAALRRAAAAAAAASTEPIPRAFLRNRPAAPITPRRALSAKATLEPLLLQIPPEIRREISRVEIAGISGHRELAQEVSQLSGTFIKHEAAARLKPVEAAIHIGTVSWRVCSSVLTVSIGAAFGVVQLAMPGWKSGYQEAAVKHATAITQKKAKRLEDSLARKLKKKKASVELEKKRISVREGKITAREAQLAAWEAKIIKQE